MRAWQSINKNVDCHTSLRSFAMTRNLGVNFTLCKVNSLLRCEFFKFAKKFTKKREFFVEFG